MALLNDRAPLAVSKGEPSHPAEESLFHSLYPKSHSFCDYKDFVAVCEGENVNQSTLNCDT